MKIRQLTHLQLINTIGAIACDYEDVNLSVFFIGCQFFTTAKDSDVGESLLDPLQEILTEVLMGPWKDKVMRPSIVLELCQRNFHK